MSIQRIRDARARMGKARLVRQPNKLRETRLEALRVLDTRGATRVSDIGRWVQSYVALRVRNPLRAK